MAAGESTIRALSEGSLAYLRQGGSEVAYAAGSPIVKKGERGRAFFVVLAGEVEVRLGDEAGRKLPLARLGPGASFGEMALLRDEPVSADVVADGPATLLEYPGERFRWALGECEPLRLDLLARLAQNLHDTSSEAWSFFRRAEALEVLTYKGRGGGPLVTASAKMKKVERHLGDAARGWAPALITGRIGTGKLFAAKKLHEMIGDEEAPLLIVDAHRLGEAETAALLRVSGDGGAGVDALHLAHRGTLLVRNVEALNDDGQAALNAYLVRQEELGERVFPLVRVVATSRTDHLELGESGALSAELATRLSRQVIAVPSMAERKLDILPLARQFLAERGEGESAWLSQDAEHALVARRFQHRNAVELREAVELGSLFSGGGEIRAEHIFSGPKVEGATLEYDLGRLPLLRGLLEGRVLSWVRAIIFAVFSAVIALCLLAPETALGQAANASIWGAWEPTIIFLFLFLGHVWCTVCPLSTAGKLAKRLGCAEVAPAGWIKRGSTWLAIGGFVAIVWTERVFHMAHHPVPTGVLLAALMLAAVVFAVIYQREVWCRYICPLGTLAASYSLPAALQVRSKPGVCATYCTTHDCYKGGDGKEGCPVYHHPLFASESHLCKLCLHCLKVCPHGAARLYLRPFLQAIWRLGGLSEGLAPFSLMIFFLSLALLAAQGVGFLAGPVGLSITTVVTVGAGVVLARLLARLLSEEEEPDPALAARVSFALLVLGWGALMAYQLGNVPGLGGIRLAPALGTLASQLLPGAEATLLAVLQVVVILLAATLAAIALARIRVHHIATGGALRRAGWRLVITLSAVYTASALVLVVARGLVLH